MDWLTRLWKLLWDPVPVVFGAIAMAVGQHLVRRFRERMVTLRWSANHQSVAISASDPTFGKVEVLHNGTPVQNLSMCYIEIENESSHDLTDMEFSVSYFDGTVFLMSVASLRGEKVLLLADEWTRTLAAFKAAPGLSRDQAAPMLDYLNKARPYRVPILNRRGKVDFAALIQVPSGVTPTVAVTCVHRGVRVRERKASLMFLGVPQPDAIWVGLLFGLAGVFVLPWDRMSPTLAVLVAFLGGSMVMLIGAGVVQLFRLIARIIG